MIRHINEAEIKGLKRNLAELIRVKKVLMKDEEIKKFFDFKLSLDKAIQVYKLIEGEALLANTYSSRCEVMTKYLKKDKVVKDLFDLDLSLDKASKVYNTITCLNLPKETFVSIHEVMTKYLINNNMVDEELSDILNEFTIDCERLNLYTEEENQEYEDYCGELDMYDCQENINDFIITIGKKLNVEIKTGIFSEIVLSDVDDDDFRRFDDVAQNYLGTFEDSDNENENEKYSEFYEMFNEDARIIILKDIKVSEYFEYAINRKFNNGYGGIATELFIDGNNTILILSDSQYTDMLSNEILLMITSELIEQKWEVIKC